MKNARAFLLLVAAGGLIAPAMAAPTPDIQAANKAKKDQVVKTQKNVNQRTVKNFYNPTDTLPFSDNFDSYTVGQAISVAGAGNGWKIWTPTSADAVVSNAQQFSGKNSLATTSFSDNVQISTPGQITSGKWKLSSKVYMPSASAGTGGGWIIGLNTFSQVSGTDNWSVQIAFDTATIGAGLIGNSGQNSVPTSMVFDQWIDCVMYIDLDADTVYATVDTGTGPIKVIDPPSSWSQGASGGGQVAIECFDFYSAGAVGFAYDDVVFEADGGSGCYPDCDLDGVLTIDDFICFQTIFAIGDPSADCDGSGILDIDDFICFQTFFAIGC